MHKPGNHGQSKILVSYSKVFNIVLFKVMPQWSRLWCLPSPLLVLPLQPYMFLTVRREYHLHALALPLVLSISFGVVRVASLTGMLRK